MPVKPLDFTTLKLINNEEQPQDLNVGFKYLGLFFSRADSSTCKEFTPRLIDYYNRRKESDKFEIVFVSSDKGLPSFRDYLATMPWLALKFDETAKKADLTEWYDVTSLPKLAILKSDGNFVSPDGHKAVDNNEPFNVLEPKK